MTKDRNFYLFWGPKWPKYWTPQAHIPHTSKSTCNEHVKQHWRQTSENFFEKVTKVPIFFTYFGVRNGPKIGPLSSESQIVHFFVHFYSCPEFGTKYFKRDMTYFTRNGVYVYGDKIACSIISIHVNHTNRYR